MRPSDIARELAEVVRHIEVARAELDAVRDVVQGNAGALQHAWKAERALSDATARAAGLAFNVLDVESTQTAPLTADGEEG